jgi:hypothetical protein
VEVLEDRVVLSFGAPQTYLVAPPDAMSVGCYNGDSFIVTAGPTTISVLFGDGEGTFGTSVDSTITDTPTGGLNATSVAVGYFDGVRDLFGNKVPDLAVANGEAPLSGIPGSVLILQGHIGDLGFWDGTFQLSDVLPLNPGALCYSVAVGHLSSTDIPGLDDVVGLDYYGNAYVWLNYGGAFISSLGSRYLTGSVQSVSVQAAPLNPQDPTEDLIVGTAGGFSVLQGNGLGTFQAGNIRYPPPYLGATFGAVTVRDINGDGIPDVIGSPAQGPSASGHYVAVWLGNGDGTFQSPNVYSVTYGGIADVGDFNGDGKQDIVVANTGDNSTHPRNVSVLLGNGNGTFLPAVDYPVAGDPLTVVTRDFDGEGVPEDIATCYFDGYDPANGVYDLPQVAVFLAQASSVATSTSLSSDHTADSIYGQVVTFTAAVGTLTAGAGTPTGSVQFDIDGNPAGSPVTLVNGSAGFTTTTLTAGNHVITAFYTSDTSNFTNSDNSASPLSQLVTPAPLTVTADNQTKVYGAPLTTLTGTLTGVVNNDGITASFTTTATQTSDVMSGGYAITPVLSDPNNRLSNYVVTSNNGTLTITPANQSITWSNPGNNLYGTPLGSAQLDATVSVIGPAPAGTLTYTPSAGTVLNPGSGQVLSVTASATKDYNAATAQVTINVLYQFSGFLPPLNKSLSFGAGRTVPISFQLKDAFGNFINSLSAVTALVVQYPDGSMNSILAGLKYDPTVNQYVDNWKTKGLPVGSYTISLILLDGTTYTQSITISKNGSGANAQAADGSDVALAGPGQLIGGDLQVYVDNSNGDLTTDELARILDAVTAIDAVTAPCGVTVEETTDSTQTEVTLNMDTTSAVGGYANGILGCFDPNAGQITMIQGWNWYAGSDATQIGTSQYDFQTTVTHELGHALGLGESTNAASAMYGTLATGTTIRTLTTADLNLPAETEASAQLAAWFGVGRISNPSFPDSRRIGNPSYEETGRDMVFAMLPAEPSQTPASSLASFLARDAFFAGGRAAPVLTLAAASLGTKPSDPVFAVFTPEGDDPLFDVPLFPESGQDRQGESNQADAANTAVVDPSVDYLPAAPSSLDP